MADEKQSDELKIPTDEDFIKDAAAASVRRRRVLAQTLAQQTPASPGSRAKR